MLNATFKEASIEEVRKIIIERVATLSGKYYLEGHDPHVRKELAAAIREREQIFQRCSHQLKQWGYCPRCTQLDDDAPQESKNRAFRDRWDDAVEVRARQQASS